MGCVIAVNGQPGVMSNAASLLLDATHEALPPPAQARTSYVPACAGAAVASTTRNATANPLAIAPRG